MMSILRDESQEWNCQERETGMFMDAVRVEVTKEYAEDRTKWRWKN